MEAMNTKILFGKLKKYIQKMNDNGLTLALKQQETFLVKF